MDASTILINLALLVPLSVIGWFFVLPRREKKVFSSLFWFPPFIVVIVPLGGFLGAAIGLAFGEPLHLASFSWVDRPLFAIQVITVCACVGGFFSYGIACLVARALRGAGWRNLPIGLVN